MAASGVWLSHHALRPMTRGIPGAAVSIKMTVENKTSEINYCTNLIIEKKIN